jgi:hypothetical protein
VVLTKQIQKNSAKEKSGHLTDKINSQYLPGSAMRLLLAITRQHEWCDSISVFAPVLQERGLESLCFFAVTWRRVCTHGDECNAHALLREVRVPLVIAIIMICCRSVDGQKSY